MTCSTHGEICACRVMVGKPDGRDHLEDRSADERIVLKLN
jgi:hypothetical protein